MPKGKRAGKPAKVVIETPTVLPAEQQQFFNEICVRLVQDTTKIVKRKIDGEYQEVEVPVKHSTEFYDKTTERTTVEDFSVFVCGSLFRHQLWNKNLGKERFDTTLPIELHIEVTTQDGVKKAISGIKMSTSVNGLKKALNEQPMMTATAFNPQNFRLGTGRETLLKMIENYGKQILAPKVKQLQDAAVKEAQELVNA